MALKDAKRCTAKAKSTGERCRNPAVSGYDVCRHHGAGTPSAGKRGGSPVTHGRYSKWKKEDIRELVASFEDDANPLDILPEIAAVRALLTDFIDRYTELVDALIAWNAAGPQGERPQRLPKLDDAISYLETVARIAQKEKRLQSDTAISRKELARILQEMGRVVDRHTDPEAQQAIRDEWSNIHLA